MEYKQSGDRLIMKFVVLGGTGMMGRIAVRDLFESSKGEIVIASTELKRAQAAADKYNSGRVGAAQIDVKDTAALSGLLRDADVAVNCVQYYFNLDVMEGALRAGAHYLDLGGLYHTTLKQLRLDPRFRKEGLSAVLGMGSTPGITNVLAAYGSGFFDSISSIDIKFGAADFSKIKGRPFPVPYSVQTLLEEFTLPPMVFKKGRMVEEKPLGGLEQADFPKPVGRKTAFYTLHSELATFPSSFSGKGVKDVSFRVSFEKEFVEKVLFLSDTGMASDKPLDYKGSQVVPRELLSKAISLQPRPEVLKLDDYECLMADMKGRKSGKVKRIKVCCMARSMPAWGAAAGDVDTGTPPSIVAQMLASGEIEDKGAFPPEFHVPHKLFFKELNKRRMKIFLG
jgi:lysine 6-dehydrogenase